MMGIMVYSLLWVVQDLYFIPSAVCADWELEKAQGYNWFPVGAILKVIIFHPY